MSKKPYLQPIDNKREINFNEELISKNEVHTILSSNFGKLSPSFFKLMSNWVYNSYAKFNDLDKYFILVFLFQKAFKHYADIFKILSEEDFYNQNEFEIDKVNLIEISESLLIPKETVRRKINELNNEKVILRRGKKIIISSDGFKHQRPISTIKLLSSYLSETSKFLATEDWFGEKKSSQDIEMFIRKNFTLIWRFFFRYLIYFLTRQRKLHGDLETWCVNGTVNHNHIMRLKEALENPFKIEKSKENLFENSYREWVKMLINSKKKIIGINASSIAEITGIPRATVIRKLRKSEKDGLIYKDKKQLYMMSRTVKQNLNDLMEVFVLNQKDINNFVAIFFEIYRNPNIKRFNN